MRDLDQALADIGAIRAQVVRGTLFRGYGPAALAATGLLALGAAGLQAMLGPEMAGTATAFSVYWALVATLAVLMIGAETVTRSRRLHSGLADEMILAAVQRFAPAAAAGALLTVLLLRVAPETAWLLPGLWQVLAGLGIFASVRLLPGTVAIPAAWYLASGLAVIGLASPDHALSPWAMGIPFGIGQLLLAGVLQVGLGGGEDA